VVEDDEGVRRYVVETLTDLNYRIIEAKSAEEAVLVFGQNSREIALLLTDIVMPGRNGRHLSDVLCKQKPGLKVIFMTGYSRDAIVHNGRLDPGVELLQKPFTQAALAQKLRQLLGFYG
jgi:CheY-like chemotaxis protein